MTPCSIILQGPVDPPTAMISKETYQAIMTTFVLIPITIFTHRQQIVLELFRTGPAIQVSHS